MARVNNALVTWNDLALMGLTAKGTPPTGLGIGNKAEIIAAYYVDEAASPFSTYTANRCPPYQTVVNTTTITTTLPACSSRSYYISGSGNFYWKDCNGIDRYSYFTTGTYICICNSTNLPSSPNGGTGYLVGGGCVCNTDPNLISQGYSTCSAGTLYTVYKDENGSSATYGSYFVNNSNVGTSAPAPGNSVQNWVNNGTYSCYSTCNKYNVQVQNNPCATQYNETRQGSLVESNSTFCGGCCGQSTAADWTIIFGDFSCSGCTKYYNEVDQNSCSPTYGVVRRSNLVAEYNSTFCGGCCGQSTTADWTVVFGTYWCNGCNKYYVERDLNSCSPTYLEYRYGAVAEYNSSYCCAGTLNCYSLTSGTFYYDGCNGTANYSEIVTITLKDQFGNTITNTTGSTLTFTFQYDYADHEDYYYCESSGTGYKDLLIYPGQSYGQMTFYTRQNQYCCYSSICDGSCYSEETNINLISSPLPACP